MFAGGVFNMVFTGTGRIALSAFGTPVVLDASQAPTYADLQSAIAWSSSLQTAWCAPRAPQGASRPPGSPWSPRRRRGTGDPRPRAC